MMTLEQLRERLKSVSNLAEIARRAGLPRVTAARIRDGHNAPNMKTYEALVAALSDKA